MCQRIQRHRTPEPSQKGKGTTLFVDLCSLACVSASHRRNVNILRMKDIFQYGFSLNPALPHLPLCSLDFPFLPDDFAPPTWTPLNFVLPPRSMRSLPFLFFQPSRPSNNVRLLETWVDILTWVELLTRIGRIGNLTWIDLLARINNLTRIGFLTRIDKLTTRVHSKMGPEAPLFTLLDKLRLLEETMRQY